MIKFFLAMFSSLFIIMNGWSLPVTDIDLEESLHPEGRGVDLTSFSSSRAITLANMADSDNESLGEEVNEREERLKTTFEDLLLRQSTSQVIPYNLLTALGAIEEEERDNNAITQNKYKLIKVLSALSASCISTVEGLITTFDYIFYSSRTETERSSLPLFSRSFNYNRCLIIAQNMVSNVNGHNFSYEYNKVFSIHPGLYHCREGLNIQTMDIFLFTATVFLSSSKNYESSLEFFEWVFREGGNYSSFSSGNLNAKIFWTTLVALCLGFKPIFTLMDIIEVGGEFEAPENRSVEIHFNDTYNETVYYTPPVNIFFEYSYIMDLFIMASVFWNINVVREAYKSSKETILSCTRGSNFFTKRQPKYTQFLQNKKNRLAQTLSAGFRRVLKEPDAAFQLNSRLHHLEEHISKKLQPQLETLRILKLQPQEINDKKIQEISNLSQERDLNDQLGSLLKLKELISFASEGETSYYITQPCEDGTCPQLSQSFCNKHPWWYTLSYNMGRSAGLLGSITMWSGWVYAIYDGFDTDLYTAVTIGSVLSAFFIPYIMDQAGKALSGCLSKCANYNPINGENYLNTAMENLSYSRCHQSFRGIVGSFISTAAGGLVNAPICFLGLSGFSFIEDEGLISEDSSYLALIQAITIGPAIGALIAAGYNKFDKHFQGLITKLTKKCMNEKQAAQQNIAYLYKKSDRWLESLDLNFVGDLDKYMKEDSCF